MACHPFVVGVLVRVKNSMRIWFGGDTPEGG